MSGMVAKFDDLHTAPALRSRACWTCERIGRLRLLWAGGATGESIAQDLATTRGAVLGKVHRLDLPPRLKPNSPDKVSAPRRGARTTSGTETRDGARVDARREDVAQRADMPACESLPTTALDLLSLTRMTCRYPVGEGSGLTQLFCGSPVTDRIYCAGHWARAHARRRT